MASNSTNALNTSVKKEDSGDNTPSSELTAVVDDLLNQLTTKFSTISSDLIAKMDEMSRRLDSLEATIQASAAQPEQDQTKSS